MLTRILSDNPGQTFTRNLDARFVETLKDLLRYGKDLSVRQMLMETLESLEQQKGWDEGLGLVIEMWKKEKEKAYKAYGVRYHLIQLERSRTNNLAGTRTAAAAASDERAALRSKFPELFCQGP